MGRVSRYKKIKSFDPFSRESAKTGRIYGSGEGSVVWGTTPDGRKAKKRSRTATKLRERKLKRRAKRGGKGGAAAAGEDDGGFDLPPGKDDFDLADLVGSLKKARRPRKEDGLADPEAEKGGDEKAAGVKPSTKPQAAVAAAKGPKATVPQTDKEERQMRRLAGVGGRGGGGGAAASSSLGGGGGDAASGGPASKPAIEPRRKGESLKKFCRRVDRESWKVIERQNEETAILVENETHAAAGGVKRGKKESVVNPERAARKRDFLKAKKARRKEGLRRHLEMERRRREGGEADGDDDDDGDSAGGLVTGEMAAAAQARAEANAAPTTGAASLHDAVDRPPEFRVVPRGAQRKRVVLPEALSKSSGDSAPKGGKRKRGMDEYAIAAERRAMEAMRRKVQEQYREMKARKRRAGEGFHL